MNIILLEYPAWINTQFSIARFYGGCKINGKHYLIVGKENDLLLKEWVPVYKKLGREKTKQLIEKGISLKEANLYISYLGVSRS